MKVLETLLKYYINLNKFHFHRMKIYSSRPLFLEGIFFRQFFRKSLYFLQTMHDYCYRYIVYLFVMYNYFIFRCNEVAKIIRILKKKIKSIPLNMIIFFYYYFTISLCFSIFEYDKCL